MIRQDEIRARGTLVRRRGEGHHEADLLEGFPKARLGGHAVDRIAVVDQQHRDLAFVHRVDQGEQVLVVGVLGTRREAGEHDGAPDGAE